MTKAAYESLRSSGMDLIENSSLTKEIVDLHQVTCHKMTSKFDEFKPIHSNNVQPFFYKHFEQVVDYAWPNNYYKLLKNHEYINILVASNGPQNYCIILKAPCLEESKRVQLLINDELNVSE